MNSGVNSPTTTTGQTLTPSLNLAQSLSVITACSGRDPVPEASLDGRLGLGTLGLSWAPPRPCLLLHLPIGPAPAQEVSREIINERL